MSILVQTFEVIVEVTPKGQVRRSSYQSGRGQPDSTKGGATTVYRKDMFNVPTKHHIMYHIEARSHDQALERGKKYGRPLSARKFHREIMSGVDYYEHKLLSKLAQKPYGSDNIFQNAIAMDEFIWAKKAKRSERIEANKKDRQGT